MDKDYKFLLTRHVRDGGLRPYAMYLATLEPSRIECSLDSACRNDPLAVFRSQEKSVETACAALELYVARVLLRYPDADSRQQTRTIYVEERPGTQALHWFLNSGKDNELIRGISARFPALVGYCLVAQGSRDFLWDWIIATQREIAGPEELKNSGNAAHTLNRLRLRAMVETLTYWTTKDHPLDEALKCYDKALDHKKDSVKGLVCLSMAGQWLSKSLRTSQGRHITRERFERFAYLCGVYIQDRAQRDHERAILALFHPDGPKVKRAWEVLVSCIEGHRGVSSPYMRHFFLTGDRRAAYQVYWFVVRTAQILDRSGRQADARYLLDSAHERMPKMFTGQRNRIDAMFSGEESIAHPTTSVEQKFNRTPERQRLWPGSRRTKY